MTLDSPTISMRCVDSKNIPKCDPSIDRRGIYIEATEIGASFEIHFREEGVSLLAYNPITDKHHRLDMPINLRELGEDKR